MAHLPEAPKPRRVLLAAAVTPVLALAAACSSSGSAGSGTATASTSGGADAGVAYAKAQIANYAPLKTDFSPPGPALTSAQRALADGALSGKTVWFVPIFQQAIQFQAEIGSFTQAMKLFGANVHVCDAQANPSGAAACVKQAVSSGAAGIVTSAIDYAFAKDGFQDAVADKIPLVLADDDETGAGALPASTVARQLSVGGVDFGKLGADWIIADSGGKANVLYGADDASSGAIQLAATQNEYKTHCPGCTLTVVHYNDGSVSKLTTAVSAALIAHPTITHVQNAYDEPSGIYAVQGIKQVPGRKVAFVAGGGSPVGLQRIRAGQESASPGVDTSQIAWNMADSIVRFAAHAPQVASYPSALRLFTATNLPSDPADAAAYSAGTWYSSGGYRAMYRQLWAATS